MPKKEVVKELSKLAQLAQEELVNAAYNVRIITADRDREIDESKSAILEKYKTEMTDAAAAKRKWAKLAKEEGLTEEEVKALIERGEGEADKALTDQPPTEETPSEETTTEEPPKE